MAQRTPLLAWAFVVFVAACGGAVDPVGPLSAVPGVDGGPGSDSAPPPPPPSTDSGMPPPPPPAAPDAFTGAPAFVSTMGGSTHNAGKACGDQGCHGQGGDGNPFLIGGTVYKDYAGTVAYPGVEVRIVDSTGKAASAYTGPEGTFHLDNSSGITLAGAMIGARDGTTARLMVEPLTATWGSCSQSGCHIAGGGVSGSPNYYPIHVP